MRTWEDSAFAEKEGMNRYDLSKSAASIIRKGEESPCKSKEKRSGLILFAQGERWEGSPHESAWGRSLESMARKWKSEWEKGDERRLGGGNNNNNLLGGKKGKSRLITS